MSYNFTVRGADKDQALTRVTAQIDAYIEMEPAHAPGRAVALAQTEFVLSELRDPADGEAISIAVLAGMSRDNDTFISSSIGVSANIVSATLV